MIRYTKTIDGVVVETRTLVPQQRRLGDLVEAVAKPIAKALKLPCLDDKGNLRPESGCAKRRDRLNTL